jgi:hypothetical protein
MNLKKKCAVFSHPQEQWAHGRCKGYMNEALYSHYLAEHMQTPRKLSKVIRQKKAAELKTLSHENGQLSRSGKRW